MVSKRKRKKEKRKKKKATTYNTCVRVHLSEEKIGWRRKIKGNSLVLRSYLTHVDLTHYEAQQRLAYNMLVSER